ncbi:hypothetical protein [Corynebacterium uterequi]|uniref:Response regulator receiver domain protein n=1 Tax=Corynebacterium uterequi TaxID=1072256 RepID=A0A0G3HBJ1_9CORY|nr:hypothetical protein [Corynebacterium uterequi]AKK10619.1 Response regulator receiver domain protein [Corynebacterium uterequi]
MSVNDPAQPPAALRIAVYSDRKSVRGSVHAAIGTTLAADLPPVELRDFATGPALIRALHNNEIDLCVLDGEAAPLGGIGLTHQIRNEVQDPPPVLLMVARKQDAWLATWSRASAITLLPPDPFELAEKAAELVRGRKLS